MTKLLALIVDDRVHEWAEGEGLRADGQAGFCKDHHTINNAFVLRTLVEQCKEAGGPSERKVLYALLTSKRLLTRCLVTCSGMSFGELEWDIRCFIACSPYTMLIYSQKGMSDAFQCTLGVKQGCPMSQTFLVST